MEYYSFWRVAGDRDATGVGLAKARGNPAALGGAHASGAGYGRRGSSPRAHRNFDRSPQKGKCTAIFPQLLKSTNDF